MTDAEVRTEDAPVLPAHIVAAKKRERRNWLIVVAVVVALIAFLWLRWVYTTANLGGARDGRTFGWVTPVPGDAWQSTSPPPGLTTGPHVGTTVLVSPKPGTKFGYIGEVSNNSGFGFRIEKVTTSWQTLSPQIVSGRAVYLPNLEGTSNGIPLPANGVPVHDGDTGYVGQEFTIPACAVHPSANPQTIVIAGPMQVTYSFLWIFHKTVATGTSVWWGLKAPLHC